MKKTNSKKNQSAEIAAQIFKNSRMPDEEIERIVNRPHLLNSITAQIRIEESRRWQKSSANVAGFFKRRVFGRMRLPAVGASAVCLLLAALFLLKNQMSQQPSGNDFNAAKLTELSERQSKNSDSATPENSARDFRASLKNKVFGEKPAPTIVYAAPRRKNLSKSFADVRRNIQKAKPARINLPVDKENDFYALNPIGIFENEGDRKIVRVEISRLKLYSLGANIAVENEPETVVADLLVGADGNPQAYRLAR